MADGLTVNPELTIGPGACSGHPVFLGSVPFPTVARMTFSVPIPPIPSQALYPVIYRILSYEPNSAPSSPQTEMPPTFHYPVHWFSVAVTLLERKVDPSKEQSEFYCLIHPNPHFTAPSSWMSGFIPASFRPVPISLAVVHPI